MQQPGSYGGKHPYGYMGIGLSELFVFVFFGLMATVGTTWTHFLQHLGGCNYSLMLGSMSVAMLMVNSIRDILPIATRKKTVAVRQGSELLESSFPVPYWLISVFFALPAAIGTHVIFCILASPAAWIHSGALAGLLGVEPGEGKGPHLSSNTGFLTLGGHSSSALLISKYILPEQLL